VEHEQQEYLMNDSVIQLEKLSKVFLTDEVETHACGKSTLLSILGLLDSPTDGSYTLNGKPVESFLPLKARVVARSKTS